MMGLVHFPSHFELNEFNSSTTWFSPGSFPSLLVALPCQIKDQVTPPTNSKLPGINS